MQKYRNHDWLRNSRFSEANAARRGRFGNLSGLISLTSGFKSRPRNHHSAAMPREVVNDGDGERAPCRNIAGLKGFNHRPIMLSGTTFTVRGSPSQT